MEAPDTKFMKIYATVETTVVLPCETLADYLKEGKFNGAVITGYNGGSVRNVTTKEHIELTEAALDAALAQMNRTR